MNRGRLHRVTGVLIRHRDLGEADRIAVLLTRERGKLSAVARGVKRARAKLAGGLQLFCHATFLLATGRTLDVITQVQPIDAFPRIRDDMARFAHASYVCELVDVLTEDEAPDEAMYEVLVAALRAIDGGADPATVVRGFELQLMTYLGYGPEMHTCVSCGTEVEGGEIGFSVQEGGVICDRCRAQAGIAPLSRDALRAMRDLIELPMDEIAKRRLKAAVGDELARTMRAYVDYRVERPLKSAAFLPR